MTRFRQLPPERGAERLPLQLELFPDPTAVTTANEHGICRAIARDSISPGWWQYVEPLYHPHGGTCRSIPAVTT